MESQSETTQTVSALKLPVLKTRDYDLWSMRMEQYLTHTDYALWEVIVNGDAPAIVSASAGTEGAIPHKTAKQNLARKNELKAKSTLLLAIPDEHLLKFHGIKDAKTLWEAIKARCMNLRLKFNQAQTLKMWLLESIENHYMYNERQLITAQEVSTAKFTGQAHLPQLKDGHAYYEVENILKKKKGRKFEFQGKEIIGFDKTKVECYNCHRRVYNDWSFDLKNGITNFNLIGLYIPKALQVFIKFITQGEHTYSKDCLKSYETLQKQYDQQCEALNKSNLEIIAVVTKLGQVPVNVAKQNSLRAAASISTARPVNTAAPKSKVNDALPKTYSYFKAHSPEDIMERAATTASSLEAELDSGNINRTQSMETLNESFPQGTNSGSGPKCQDTILGGAEAQTRFEAASKQSNDPPLSRVNTLGSREDDMKLNELMEFCNKLYERALDL
ncbi:hypothetical protein Tco_0122896 [Tanacetum coccineum]